MTFRVLSTLVLLFSISACTNEAKNTTKKVSTKEFLKTSNEKLMTAGNAESTAAWVHTNFITPDTTKMSAEYSARYSTLATDLANESKNYQGQTDDEKRMLSLMQKVLTVPAPQNNASIKKLSKLKSELESLYGSGKYCKTEGDCKNLGELEKIIAKSRNPQELLDAWNGWRTIAVPMKEKYIETVNIGNQGSKELGYAQMSDFWRSKYDMEPKAFEQELDRLWG